MQVVRTTNKGIDYLTYKIAENSASFTEIVFWKIPRSSGASEIHLKLGKYHQQHSVPIFDEYSKPSPKCEVTLNANEFDGLVNFLQENYEPFRQGFKQFIALEKEYGLDKIGHLREIFSGSNKSQALDLLVEHKLVSDELLIGLNHAKRCRTINMFEEMLSQELSEGTWQKWFENNSWVLGTEFVGILDQRSIDTANISDFLMKAYDGFVDLIEIKRPSSDLAFWAKQKDHDNYIPSTDLVKAITQAAKYIYELEREANNVKFFERVGYIKTIKPRVILLFGRSNDWNIEQVEAYRLLNSLYHNISILTYDHVLNRAKKIVGLGEKCI